MFIYHNVSNVSKKKYNKLLEWMLSLAWFEAKITDRDDDTERIGSIDCQVQSDFVHFI